MTGGTTQQAAQNVTATFIARHDTVGDQKTDCTRMVVNDAKRNIFRGIGAVFFIRVSLRSGGGRAHMVDIVIGRTFCNTAVIRSRPMPVSTCFDGSSSSSRFSLRLY